MNMIYYTYKLLSKNWFQKIYNNPKTIHDYWYWIFDLVTRRSMVGVSFQRHKIQLRALMTSLRIRIFKPWNVVRPEAICNSVWISILKTKNLYCFNIKWWCLSYFYEECTACGRRGSGSRVEKRILKTSHWFRDPPGMWHWGCGPLRLVGPYACARLRVFNFYEKTRIESLMGEIISKVIKKFFLLGKAWNSLPT